MIGLKVFVLGFTHNAQAGRDGALASGHNSASQKQFKMVEDGLGKKRGEYYNDIEQIGRQSEHRNPFLVESSKLTLPVVHFQSSELDKVELRQIVVTRARLHQIVSP